MPHVKANELQLEYEIGGPADGRPLLMIHGVGAQLIRWPQEFCDALGAAGFRTIRYDSRDVGLSTHLYDAPVPSLAAIMQARRRGEEPKIPYTVSHLAADAAALLRALRIESAHVLGVSLGGQIAQTLAIEYPQRVLSLTLMMTHTGNPDLPPSAPEAMEKLAAVAPNPFEDEAGYLEHSVALNRALGSPDYPIEDEVLRDFAARAARRAFYPSGAARQLAASRGSPDRRPDLGRLNVPTLVIHGTDDPLVPVEGGEDIARNVKGAMLLKINGMGHDLPRQLFDIYISALGANSRRSQNA
jgi:pimeloyl-ACP methyl ester carboxylesterase